MNLLSPIEEIKKHCYIFKIVMTLALVGIAILSASLLSNTVTGKMTSALFASIFINILVLSFTFYLYRVYYSMCVMS